MHILDHIISLSYILLRKVCETIATAYQKASSTSNLLYIIECTQQLFLAVRLGSYSACADRFKQYISKKHKEMKTKTAYFSSSTRSLDIRSLWIRNYLLKYSIQLLPTVLFNSKISSKFSSTFFRLHHCTL